MGLFSDEVGGGGKALSWKDAPAGTKVRGVVSSLPQKLVQTDYKTKEPLFWDEERTRPKYQIVFGLTVDGVERSVWVKLPSRLAKAIAAAERESGDLALGSILEIETQGILPDKSRGFSVIHEPPTGSQAGPADPWADEAPPF